MTVTTPSGREVRDTSLAAWVVRHPAEVLSRLLVVSPHFDDAVLGAGQLIAAYPGSTVLTVMGGPKPGGYADVTWWDAFGGFAPGDDVVEARWAEDAAALDVLGAHGRRLGFVDHQYGQPTDAAAAAAGIAEVVDELQPSAVLIPMGLANPDHETTNEACVRVLLDRPELRWLAYAEAGYSLLPTVLANRLASLRSAGVYAALAGIPVPDARAKKLQALQRYASQLPALADDWDFDPELEVNVPESFWTLTRGPA